MLPRRNQPLLFQRFAQVAQRVPFCPLGHPDTPVERLSRLGGQIGRDLWVKRDDLYGSPGGGKVRKLEFALADILARGKRSVITFGPLGSNHVAATATHARDLGIETLGILVPQPVQHYVRGNLERSCRQGQVVFARLPGSAPFRAIQHWLRRRFASGQSPALLMPGGSSVVGILGYVEAALEIARDVEQQKIPEPDFVFIAAGTCGAIAGLAAGLRIAGLKSRPIGVRVCGRFLCNATSTVWLANRALAFLRKRGAVFDVPRIRQGDVRVLHEFCGRGYAHATKAGRHALNLAWDNERLALDTTYTAKALAGLFAFMAQPQFSKARALFVNTWAPSPPVSQEHESLIPGRLAAWLDRREAIESGSSDT